MQWNKRGEIVDDLADNKSQKDSLFMVGAGSQKGGGGWTNRAQVQGSLVFNAA